MPRATKPVDVNSEGHPISPERSADVRHGSTFDAVIARDFLGLALRRRYVGARVLNHWIFEGSIRTTLEDGHLGFGPYRDIPPWSVSGDEALYLLDFVEDFELGTTANGVRCSLWLSYKHPTWPDSTEVPGYGEADRDEFGTPEEWMRHQGRKIGFGPALGLAICRAVYQASQDMNDVMLDLHHANVKKILNVP